MAAAGNACATTVEPEPLGFARCVQHEFCVFADDSRGPHLQFVLARRANLQPSPLCARQPLQSTRLESVGLLLDEAIAPLEAAENLSPSSERLLGRIRALRADYAALLATGESLEGADPP